MLTVLISTRNRETVLRRVFESYLELDVPETGWKIVLVDNGSSDGTRQAVSDYADRLPLEYVFEPKPGQAVGLNRGLELVEGDLVVKSDDDAFPQSDWLLRLRNAADENPEYGVFGGAILPEWEEEPNHMLHAQLSWAVLYALTDPERREGSCPANFIFGPNMAIRKRFFDEGYRFDEGVGPVGKTYPMGSETDLLMRLARNGVRSRFVPDAKVYHFIRKEQLGLGWVFRRAINFGRGQCVKVVKAGDSACPVFLGVPRYLVKKMLRQCFLVIKAGFSLQQPEVIGAVWQLMFLKGFIQESRRHPWQE